jgi:HlyD family secretion protein
VILIVLASAGGWAYHVRAQSRSAPTIVTAVVTRGDVVETVDATGTLQAVTTVQVGTQVSGTIKALHADFNSRVRRGQLVAELEPSLFDTQVEQARASLTRLQADVRRAEVQLEDAQQKLKRARELAARGLLAPSDLETADVNARVADAALKGTQAQVVQGVASLHQAEVNLAHTIIRAPIDGIVISRNVDVGQTVAASMQAPTLFIIARDLREMQVEASVAESDIGHIQTGQPVSFTVDAYPGERFTGTVSQVRLQPVIEQNVVSYVTVIDVPNPDLRLKPGMTANVAIETARATNVLRVPNAALRVRPAAKGEVLVLNQGQLTVVPVRAAVTDGMHTAVVAPELAEGSHVVTSMSDKTPAVPATSTSPLLPARGRGTGTARGAASTPRSGR